MKIIDRFTGLDPIDSGSIGGLHIESNEILSICEVQSVCEYLALPDPYLGIHYNAPGCRWEEEIEAKCGYGMNENNASNYLIAVSPNPSSTSITIKLPEPAAQFQFSIFNLNSQEIISGPVTESETFIDISSLPGGIYFVRVTMDRTVMVGKFVKW